MRWENATLIGALLVAALAGLAIILTGCGATAVQTHARAATATGLTLTQTRAMLIDARRADLDAVEEATEGQDPALRLAMVDERGERWEPAFVAFNALRAALATWVESIALAHAAGDGGDLLGPALALAARVLALWAPLAAVLEQLGVEGVPELPGVLGALVGGGE